MRLDQRKEKLYDYSDIVWNSQFPKLCEDIAVFDDIHINELSMKISKISNQELIA